MVQLGQIRYFADENALGMAKILDRENITYPGHPLLPEIPLGTDDQVWLQLAGQRGWLVLTRDRRIRTRPAELDSYRRHGVRSVWLGGKHDLTAIELAEMFRRHESRLTRVAIKLGRGPWAVAMTDTGVRPLRLREP